MAQRVEIVSAGSPRTTRVLVDGSVLERVQRVAVVIDAAGRCEAWIKVAGVHVDADFAAENVKVRGDRDAS